MSDQAEAATSETETPSEVKSSATPADEMTSEEKSFLMLTLWDALIAPKWTKDTLIDFGKAIFSKKKFKDMSDKEFNQVFPFLTVVTSELGKKLVQKTKEKIEEAEKVEKTDKAEETK